jgi:hypothetical protein
MSSGDLKKVGSFIGTGAAKEIELDFTPTYVKVVNMTTGLSAEKFAEAEISTKEGGLEHDHDTLTFLTAAQGITLGERKFTVGTAASVNGSTNHLVFLALR